MTDENEHIVDIENERKLLEEKYKRELEVKIVDQENKGIQARLQNVILKDKEERMMKNQALRKEVENEDFFSRGFDEKQMRKDLEDRKNAITFINTKVSEHFIAAPGSLIVIPSMTNNGKSTLTAAIAETLVSEGKRVLILSNEETEEDSRARISCLRTFVSFGDYKASKCSDDQINKVLKDAKKLVDEKLLVVISPKTEADAFKVTYMEGVMDMLHKANGKFHAVIIDYYTNVNRTEKGNLDPWHVNNDFATELNTFKNNAQFPIILTAQCESVMASKKDVGVTFADMEASHPAYRWKGGKSILTYATDIIELKREFDKSCSLLFAHKIRFGHGELQRGQTLWFDKKMQRFIEKFTPEFDAQLAADRVKNNVNRSDEEQSKINDLLKG